MTREQQRQLKNLKKELPHMVQAEIKKYKIKKKDFMIWRQKERDFYDAHIHVGEKDGKCFCSVTGYYKPMWLDELFWEIMGMEDNKKEPVSLRSIGAFTVYGNKFMQECREVVSWSEEELSVYVREYVSGFAAKTEEGLGGRFAEDISGSPYHAEIREALYLIHQERYEDAIRYVAAMDQDFFENRGVGFRKAATRHCRKRIQ